MATRPAAVAGYGADDRLGTVRAIMQHRDQQGSPFADPDDLLVTGSRPSDIAQLQEFTAVLAHELKTPLAIIASAVELALAHERRTTGPDVGDLLRMIQRNSRLACQLLDRLQLAGDVEAGTIELSLEDVDLHALVQESIDDLRDVVMAGHPVTLRANSSPVVRADATAAREIVFNLLSNAAKYSADGAAVDVTIDVGDGAAVVVVRNHGKGVTPGDSDRIFERSFQNDPDSPGSGLGLFVSRGLARAHGGDLTVHPADQEGSEFELTLPRATAAP